ncbi:hypothetical protein NPIL_58231 [Nephila pilipes]|uniref:Uncharacterized protein n=1 Tax=Nephila pilipes TaxID=299642 RepID=A0A8X6NKG0_NEPPI|nr:hypothetical protein NPIL_58231 [Nephila pilipes]
MHERREIEHHPLEFCQHYVKRPLSGHLSSSLTSSAAVKNYTTIRSFNLRFEISEVPDQVTSRSYSSTTLPDWKLKPGRLPPTIQLQLSVVGRW